MGGAVSYAPPLTLEPSTTSRTGRRGKPSNIGTLGIQHGTGRQSVIREDGRGQPASGERTEKRETDEEEARGGERDARAGKLVVDKELGAG